MTRRVRPAHGVAGEPRRPAPARPARRRRSRPASPRWWRSIPSPTTCATRCGAGPGAARRRPRARRAARPLPVAGRAADRHPGRRDARPAPRARSPASPRWRTCPRTSGVRLVQVTAVGAAAIPSTATITHRARRRVAASCRTAARAWSTRRCSPRSTPGSATPSPSARPGSSSRHGDQRARRCRGRHRVRPPGLHLRRAISRRPGCSASARAPSTRPSSSCRRRRRRPGDRRQHYRPGSAARAGADPHRVEDERAISPTRSTGSANYLGLVALDRAAAGRTRRGERGPGVHPAEARHHRGAALPRRHRAGRYSWSTWSRPPRWASSAALLGAALGLAVAAGAAAAAPRLLPVDVAVAVSPGRPDPASGLGLWVALVFALIPAARRSGGCSPLVTLRRDYEPSAGRARSAGAWAAFVRSWPSVVGLAAHPGRELLRDGAIFAAGVGGGARWCSGWRRWALIRRCAPLVSLRLALSLAPGAGQSLSARQPDR